MRIGLVGCVKTKQQIPAPAAELYTSPLFRGRRAVVEASCDRWYVLSAQHGLVAPDQVLEPYDAALTAVPVSERRLWAARVLAELNEQLDTLEGRWFELHAGAAYTDFGLAAGLRAAGATVELPVAGLTMGEQLAWYGDSARAANAPDATFRPRKTPQVADGVTPRRTNRSSRYAPLGRHLDGHEAAVLTVSFDDIETLLAVRLPASARRHRAWWANNAAHSQARSWLEAGYRVDAVDQRSGWVRFRRDQRS